MRKLACLLILPLLACQPAPSALTPAAQREASHHEVRMLWGQAAPLRSVQALESDLNPYGTVSLLDASNQVVASGTTTSAGAFSLNPFVSFNPSVGMVYVLDLTKRFEGTNENALLRLRTLVRWTGSEWESIAGSTSDGGVMINAGTTAIACIQGLRALTASSMVGALDPTSGAFTPGSTGIGREDFDAVKALVGSALAANLDPVRGITWSAVDNAYSARLAPRAGRLVFDLVETPASSGSPPSPIRTPYGMGVAFATVAALYESHFGSYGTTDGLFRFPVGLAIDRYGQVAVNDSANHRIDRFDSAGNYVETLAGSGWANGQVQKPGGMAYDAEGNFWVADFDNHRVQKFDHAGKFLFGIGHGTTWSSGTTAPATASGTANGWFNNPHFLAVEPNGNLWVTEYGNHRLQVFSSTGVFQRGIGNGTTWTGAAPGPISGTGFGSFNGPSGIAFDAQGTVWICDRNNHRLQRFEKSGTFLGVFGSAGSGSGQFSSPHSLAFDGAGNLWVSELGNHRVQVFDRQFGYLGKVGSLGAAPGQFNNAEGLAFDRDGQLLVADYLNYRVQRFVPANIGQVYAPPENYNFSKGTFETWFYPYWGGIDGGQRLFLRVRGGNRSIGIHYNGGNFYAFFGDGTTSLRIGADNGDSVKLIKARQWHHLATVWDASTGELRLYLNGKEYGSFVTSPLPGTPLNWGTTPVSDYAIGAETSGTWNASSILAGTRIYDHVKSPTEIARDYSRVEQQ